MDKAEEAATAIGTVTVGTVAAMDKAAATDKAAAMDKAADGIADAAITRTGRAADRRIGTRTARAVGVRRAGSRRIEQD